jgi:glycosidase
MAFSQDDIIYWIITDRFYGKENTGITVDKNNPKAYHGGNFDGIIEKIPYFKSLGITALWITPVYAQISENKNNLYGYHGYWALDFNKIDHHLYIDNGKYEKGSKLYLKDLVDKLHENGIKLILDMVVSHTGYFHPGLSNQKSNPTPIKKNWFVKAYEQSSNSVEIDMNELPKLNLNNPDVCDYHIQTIVSWIKETGIDAIRIDTAKQLEFDFWNYYKIHINGRYPNVSLIGEVLLFSADDIAKYEKNRAFDSFFDYPLQRAIEWVFAWNNSMESFVSAYNRGIGILERDNIYTNSNKLITLLDNHDLPSRFMTTVLYAVNQDIEDATKIVKLALSFLFSVRGIPQIYYGTEIGMQGGPDPDNRKDFEWEKFNSNNDVLPKYKIERELFEHTRKLIKIRKENKALTAGSLDCLYVDHFLMVFLRYNEDDVIIGVIHNGWYNAETPITINIDLHNHIPERVKSLVRNKLLTCQLTGKTVQVENGQFQILAEGKSALILK